MLKNKWLLRLGLSFIIGVSFSFYHLLIPEWSKNANYSPLTLNTESPSFAVDETIYYASKTREILDGNWQLKEPMIWEYKDKASVHLSEWLPAVIMAGLSFLGGGIAQGFMLADFIGPIINFWLVYFLLNLLTKNKPLSVFGSLATLILYNYWQSFPYLPSVVKIIFDSFTLGAYSPFGRAFHPQISFPFLVAFLIFCRQNKWLEAGILAGLLAYTHFFYFCFAVIFLGIILIVKNPRKIIPIAKVGLLICLPLIVNFWQFRQSGLAVDFLNKFRFNPPLSINQGGLLILLWLGQLLIKDKNNRQFWLIVNATNLLLIVGGHIFKLGLDDPIGHWLSRTVHPLLMIMIFSIIGERLKKIPAYLFICLTGLLLGYQALINWQYFKTRSQMFNLEPEKSEVFNWLNLNTPKNSVVVTASLKDNLYLLTYTHNRVFIPRAQLSLAPTNEAVSRLLSVNKVIGKTETGIKDMFQENQELKKKKRFDFDNCAGVYLYFRQYIERDYYNCAVPEEKLTEILEQYRNIKPDLTNYRADYWLWGAYENQWANVNPDDFGWQLIWKNQSYKLFKLP